MSDKEFHIDNYGYVPNILMDAMRAHFQKENTRKLDQLRDAIVGDAMGVARKVEAIKIHRELTGSGLLESKNYVESLMGVSPSDNNKAFVVFVTEHSDAWYKLNPNIGRDFETINEAKDAANRQLTNYPESEILVCRVAARTERVLKDC